eukprot:tig00001471_g8874.t1
MAYIAGVAAVGARRTAPESISQSAQIRSVDVVARVRLDRAGGQRRHFIIQEDRSWAEARGFRGQFAGAGVRAERRQRQLADESLIRCNAAQSTGAASVDESTAVSSNGNGNGNGSDAASTSSTPLTKIDNLLQNDENHRPSLGERARTLATICNRGTLCSASARHGAWPFGSHVDYILDEKGRPVFYLSHFATHTANLKEDSRCSLFLHPEGNKYSAQADARVTLMGRCHEVPAEEVESLRSEFLMEHQHYADVVNFQNFKFYRMEVMEVYFVAGFGSTAKWVYSADYVTAEPDCMMEEGPRIVQDFNKSRVEDLRAMVETYAEISLGAEDAVRMKSIDRLGFDVRIVQQEGVTEVRIPFDMPHGRSVAEPLEARSALSHMALQAWESHRGMDAGTAAVRPAGGKFAWAEVPDERIKNEKRKSLQQLIEDKIEEMMVDEDETAKKAVRDRLKQLEQEDPSLFEEEEE